MNAVRLVAVALFAALPLAGCGNKGQLILNPEPQEMPPEVAASMAPPSSATVALPSSSTIAPPPATSIAPPPATTTAPPADSDGTPGKPR